MLNSLPMILVLFAGAYLVVLGGLALLFPQRTRQFLGRFASSAKTHYLEQAIRIVIGMAFVLAAPQLRFPDLLSLFGWILIVSSAGLLFIPWRWHRSFAKWAVPLATRSMPLFATVSFLAGTWVIMATLLAT